MKNLEELVLLALADWTLCVQYVIWEYAQTVRYIVEI